ncbi:hypothetical protein DW083_20975 [Parabacteroides sp. AF48-14]|nr:hypothetical protein DW083_20975 [Parabacteroides sp. AF48-14]
MWLLMAVFVLAGCQTIEWCMDSGTEIPWQVWAMLVTAATWCILMLNIPSRAQRRFEQFIDWLSDEG